MTNKHAVNQLPLIRDVADHMAFRSEAVKPPPSRSQSERPRGFSLCKKAAFEGLQIAIGPAAEQIQDDEAKIGFSMTGC